MSTTLKKPRPKQHAPSPFWIYELLAKSRGSSKAELPELVLPRGDEEWTSKDGLRMKWCDGWRGCWHSILDEFLPFAETRSVVRYGKKRPRGVISPEQMTAYEPCSGKEWLINIDDTAMGKDQAQPLNDLGVENYKFINDVFGWALDCTLKYCRYRMRWGDWAMGKRGKDLDVSDTYFFNWPQSQRACKFLVRWFVRFSNARRQYHLHIAGKVKRPWYTQTRTAKNVTEIITEHKGRPPKLRMGKKGNEDLWLILIWPVAIRHRWTYRDVVRAVRLHFAHGRPTRPALKMTSPEAFENEIEAFIEWRHSRNAIEEYVPKAEAKWRAKALKVSETDAEAIRLHCKRLWLEKLNPGRRDKISEPRFFSLVNRFQATQ